jgi:predicted ATPase
LRFSRKTLVRCRVAADTLLASARLGSAPERDAAKAQTSFERALEIARAQQARSFELRAATSLARLRRDQGRHGEALGLLAPVYGWFTEGFDTPDLKEAGSLPEELASVGHAA